MSSFQLKYRTEKEGDFLRIYALKDILGSNKSETVRVGSRGGLIKSEDNLSQDGECWVYDGCEVTGDAVVKDNAKVYGECTIDCHAVICDNATVKGECQIAGHAIIRGNTRIRGKVRITGDVIIGRDKNRLMLVNAKGNRLPDCYINYKNDILAISNHVSPPENRNQKLKIMMSEKNGYAIIGYDRLIKLDNSPYTAKERKEDEIDE